MILPAHTAKLAANGRATVALIPVRQPRTITRKGKIGRGTTYTTQPWAPCVGRREPLRSSTNGRAAKIADIVLSEHFTMLLAAVLDPGEKMLAITRAAGFKSRAELAREWLRAHDTRDWPPMIEELCPRCEGTALLRDCEECPDCDCGVILVEDTPDADVTVARFKARHGLTLVHVVSFHLDKSEHVRLLSPSSRPRGDDLGYTPNPANAMEDAGEAVPAAFQKGLSRKASERDHAQRQEQLQSGDVDELAAAQERGARRHARGVDRAARHREAA